MVLTVHWFSMFHETQMCMRMVTKNNVRREASRPGAFWESEPRTLDLIGCDSSLKEFLHLCRLKPGATGLHQLHRQSGRLDYQTGRGPASQRDSWKRDGERIEGFFCFNPPAALSLQASQHALSCGATERGRGVERKEREREKEWRRER